MEVKVWVGLNRVLRRQRAQRRHGTDYKISQGKGGGEGGERGTYSDLWYGFIKGSWVLCLEHVGGGFPSSAPPRN